MGQDVEVLSLLIWGTRLQRSLTMLMQPKHGSPSPPPSPSKPRGTRLQRSQTMPETPHHGFPNQAHCPGEKTAAESTLCERVKHGSPS